MNDELSNKPVLFLDIDGVLNGHQKYATGYSGIHRDRAEVFNTVIKRVPELKIIISSAWRYLILQGSMTLKGFEQMLLIHGVLCHGRIIGFTPADGPLGDEPDHQDRETWTQIGLCMRSQQIRDVVREYQIGRFAVVDDLPLDVPNFVQTNGNLGLTAADADRLVELLK